MKTTTTTAAPKFDRVTYGFAHACTAWSFVHFVDARRAGAPPADSACAGYPALRPTNGLYTVEAIVPTYADREALDAFCERLEGEVVSLSSSKPGVHEVAS